VCGADGERSPIAPSLRVGSPDFIGQNWPFYTFAGSRGKGPAFGPWFFFQIFAVYLYYVLAGPRQRSAERMMNGIEISGDLSQDGFRQICGYRSLSGLSEKCFCIQQPGLFG